MPSTPTPPPVPVFGQGSAQQVSILSLTDFDRSIWHSPRQLGAGVALRGPRRPIYCWDLHALADDIGDYADGGYKSVAPDSPFWNAIWTSGFTDDAGNAVLQALPTVFAVNPFNRYMAGKNRYDASLTFQPLAGNTDPLPQPEATVPADSSYSETAAVMRVIRDLCVIPAFPVLVATTLPSHNTYGPLFLSGATFSVAGDTSPGPVAVSVKLAGGKSLRLDAATIVPFETAVQNPPPPTNPPTPQHDPPVLEYRAYRKANLTDCLVGFFRAESLPNMRNKIKKEALDMSEKPGHRVVSMLLNINQTVTLRAPTPAPPRTDDHGPRYAQIESFAVSGSLKFYSREKQLGFRTGPLTLYFGGPFLFSMPCVDFDWPTLALATATGYLHEVNFIARAPKNTVPRAFLSGAEGLPVSQFSPLK